MSVVVLFEAEFVPGGRERYLALAQKIAERARFSVSVDVSQYVLFGFLAAGAFGTVAGGFLIDRFGRRNVIFWGSSCIVVGKKIKQLHRKAVV